MIYDGIKYSQCVDCEAIINLLQRHHLHHLNTSGQWDNELNTTNNTSASTSSTPYTPTTSKESTPTPHITLSKLSDIYLSKFHHKIAIIVDGFSIYSPTAKLLYKTKIECEKYVVENFTHLDKTDEKNICVYNAHHSTFNTLFTNNLSLERLLNLECTIGWLDNVMFTFFTAVLHFLVEYNIKKQLSDVLPAVVFTDKKN